MNEYGNVKHVRGGVAGAVEAAAHCDRSCRPIDEVLALEAVEQIFADEVSGK